MNGILWSATSIGSVVYVLFGVMGAAAFEQAGPNLLVLLASNKVTKTMLVFASLNHAAFVLNFATKRMK